MTENDKHSSLLITALKNLLWCLLKIFVMQIHWAGPLLDHLNFALACFDVSDSEKKDDNFLAVLQGAVVERRQEKGRQTKGRWTKGR